ncbi:MAG: class I SAM-dependent methyltransferase, partial [Candidatus Hermodarchaeota archaeon]
MHLHRGNTQSNLEFLKKTSLLKHPKKILEIGAGSGYLVNYLKIKGYYVIGCETNEDYIDFAKNHFGLNLVKVSDSILPFDNSFFDIVISFDVFEHISNSDKHLQEIKRVLKPGGYYLLGTPNKL